MEAIKFSIVLFLCWFAAVQCASQEEEAALSEHNRLRDLHGVPHLTLNADLSKASAAYAVELTNKQSMVHSNSDGQYGENLCYHTSNPEICVQMWYDEIEDYDFSKPGFSLSTGHFTQLVWAESTEMGWGQATDSKGVTYVVARYTPPGNVEGQFEKNVPRPSGQAPGKIEGALNAMTIVLCFGLLKFAY